MRNREKDRTHARPVFEKRQGRLVFFWLLLRWPIAGFLSRTGRKYLRSGHRQMVIFCFDHIGHEINIDGIYEKDYLEAFFAWLKKSSVDTKSFVALDIGANIGNHSLYFASHFREIVAFEPNPRTFKVLRLNADLATNITCHAFGLSSESREGRLNLQVGNVGAASLLTPAETGINVALRTLDSLDGLSDVKLVKIDVEGHEAQVLEGGRALLLRDQPIILLEQHARDFIHGQSPSLSILKELGYRQFAVLTKYPETDRDPIRKYMVAPLLMLLFGRSIRVKVVADIEPGDYTFIVALPKWLPV